MTKTPDIFLRLILFFAMITVLFTGCAQSSKTNDDGAAHTMMEHAWKEFRTLHPESFQTVALRHYGDTCVFVISEPSCRVSVNELERLFAQYEGEFLVGRYKQGYDGMVCDAVGCAVLDSFAFAHLERDIFTLVYGTDYKPYYTDLDTPSSHVYFSPVNLNFKISNEDLVGWLKDELFRGPDLRETALEDLMSERTSSGIYLSKNPGFVIWKINYDALPVSKADARRFSLDTDLIAGALEGENSVLIIAREREVPVTILPPLCAETIVGLSNNELGECQVWLPSDSCIFIDDSIYATPFTMNNSLRMSDFGLLLTTADQKLKSWCVNGATYDRFSVSPIPILFPFKDGVVNALGFTPTCTWKIPEMSGQSVVHSISRTGSPASIFTSSTPSATKEIMQAETTAQEWFASLNCTDLVRVNQYMFLYAIFSSIPNAVNTTGERGVNSSWVIAPSMSVSNSPWLNGGCITGIPIKPPKIKPPHIPAPRVPAPVVPRPGLSPPPVSPVNVAKPVAPVLPNINTPSRVQQNTVMKPTASPPHDGLSLPTKTGPHSMPRTSFISRPPADNDAHERGFVPSRHNIAVEVASSAATQVTSPPTSNESSGWRDKIRQKVMDKIHRINTIEMQTDKFLIFGHINHHNNGTQHIYPASKTFPFPYITSPGDRIRA